MNNTYNQLYAKNPNSLIHYIDSLSCFDLLIDYMMHDDIVRFDNISIGQYFTIKNILLNDYKLFIASGQPDAYFLFAQPEASNLFIHTDISFMKREDIFLIKNRLSAFNVINFHPDNKKIFENTIQPAVPKIKISSNHKNNKILILDNSYHTHLSEILKKTQIDLIDFKLYQDYYSLINKISEYSLVIYSNYIDGIVSQSAGCPIIPSHSILKNKKIIQSDIITNQKINYDLNTFSKQLIKAIKK